jgi:hypothetical protein
MNELPNIQACTVGYDSCSNNEYGNIFNRRITAPNIWDNPPTTLITGKIKQKEKEIMSSRRLVKVMIVDPNESVPLDKAVLVNEAEKITDLEDDEIFFDMDIKNILEKHNTYRITVIDKELSKTKEKDVMLEPIRIKDLKMVVLTIAKF